MASIPSLTSSSTYDGRKMTVSGSQTKGTSAQNKSTVHWTLKTHGGASATYYDTGPTTLTINGTQRYYKDRTSWSSFAFPAAAGEVSGSFDVSHNNDGSIGGIPVSLTTAIYTGSWNSRTDTTTWYLDSIARYFSSTPSLSNTGRTEKTLSYSWSTSETCDYVDVYVNGSWYSKWTGSATSGTFTVSGCSPNTSYNVYINCRRKDSGQWSSSGTVSKSTYALPSLSTANNFTIGNDFKVSFTNPRSKTITVSVVNSQNVTKSLSTTGTSVTFNNTNVSGWEDSFLYPGTPSSTTGTLTLTMEWSGTDADGSVGKTISYYCKGNEQPTFSGTPMSYNDTNTTITAITGQTGTNGWLVQGLSTLTATLNSAASPKKSATISSYTISFNDDTPTAISVGGTKTWNSSKLNFSGTKAIKVVATDSRGYTCSATLNVTVQPYSAPVITLVGERVNNYGTAVTMKANWQASDVQDKNRVTMVCSYKYDSGSSLVSHTQTLSGNPTGSTISESFALEKPISNSANREISIKITDSFGYEATDTYTIPVGIPIMFVDEVQNGVGIETMPRGRGLYVGKSSLAGDNTWDGMYYDDCEVMVREEVHVGTSAPTSDKARVWINPNGLALSWEVVDEW